VAARGSGGPHGDAYRGTSGYDDTHDAFTGGCGGSLKGGDRRRPRLKR
jgi:hypothetical protein